MELGLAGKTVIVTGGASNVGRGIVLAFAGEGSHVVIADIDGVQSEKTAALARKRGGAGYWWSRPMSPTLSSARLW